MRINKARNLAAALALAAALPLRASEPPGLEAVERAVLATEDAYVAAEVSRDAVALRRLVDDRFAHNRASGTTAGKEDLIQSVMRLPMTGQALSERTVLVEGHMALIFGTAELRFAEPDGSERISTQRYTSTWVNRHGQWRMLALQMQPRTDP